MATRTIAADELGLADAIAATEEEIFAEGIGTEPLEKSGDRSLEEQGDDLEGRTTEEEDGGEEIEAKPEDKGEPEAKPGEGEKPRDEKTGQFTQSQDDARLVPSSRLREETAKRTQAEQALAERDRQLAEFGRNQAELTRLYQDIQARLSAPPRREQQQQEAPDPFGDPIGFGKQTMDRAVQVAEMRYVEGSLADAAETHGEKFTAAYNELQQLGRVEQQQYGTSPTVRQIWSAPNPGKALMRWHQERLTVREIGTDPASYREKILADALKDEAFIAKVVEAASGSARRGDGGRPRTVTRIPPSLNSQSGSTHQVEDPDLYNGSEASVFEFATR
jgi:hypothetical protein